jgi:hypothetical protein
VGGVVPDTIAYMHPAHSLMSICSFVPATAVTCVGGPSVDGAVVGIAVVVVIALVVVTALILVIVVLLLKMKKYKQYYVQSKV